VILDVLVGPVLQELQQIQELLEQQVVRVLLGLPVKREHQVLLHTLVQEVLLDLPAAKAQQEHKDSQVLSVHKEHKELLVLR
jgi:hypothetical protein